MFCLKAHLSSPRWLEVVPVFEGCSIPHAIVEMKAGVSEQSQY